MLWVPMAHQSCQRAQACFRDPLRSREEMTANSSEDGGDFFAPPEISHGTRGAASRDPGGSLLEWTLR
jgi:hypothetical protein